MIAFFGPWMGCGTAWNQHTRKFQSWSGAAPALSMTRKLHSTEIWSNSYLKRWFNSVLMGYFGLDGILIGFYSVYPLVMTVTVCDWSHGYRDRGFTHSMVDLSRSLCKRLPDGKSHQIPLNHHFPMVFLWFFDHPNVESRMAQDLHFRCEAPCIHCRWPNTAGCLATLRGTGESAFHVGITASVQHAAMFAMVYGT